MIAFEQQLSNVVIYAS